MPKFKRQFTLILIVFGLLASNSSCSTQLGPTAQCKIQAETRPSDKEIREQVEEVFSNSDKNSELLESAVQAMREMTETPDYAKTEWISCMTDIGAFCYFPSSDDLPIPNSAIERLLIERGWQTPTAWDCYSPKTKLTIQNPFDS